MNTLADNPTAILGLTSINLKGNSVKDEGTKALCNLLTAMGHTSLLQSLNLSYTDTVLAPLLPILSDALKHSLITLNLSGITLSSVTVNILQSSIVEFQQLQNLILRNCDLTEILVENILTSLQENSKIRRINLDLSANSIGKFSVNLPSLRQSLRCTDNLYELNLCGNPIKENDWPVIFSGLSKHDYFRRLQLNIPENLDDATKIMSHLSEFLEQQALERLTIHPNFKKQIHGKVFAPLLIALEKNPPLRELDIRNNRLGDSVISSLIKSLSSNSHLFCLLLDGNGCTITSWQGLYELVFQNNGTLSTIETPQEDINDYLETHSQKQETVEIIWKNIRALLEERRESSSNFKEYRKTLTADKMEEVDAKSDSAYAQFQDLFKGILPTLEQNTIDNTSRKGNHTLFLGEFDCEDILLGCLSPSEESYYKETGDYKSFGYKEELDDSIISKETLPTSPDKPQPPIKSPSFSPVNTETLENSFIPVRPSKSKDSVRRRKLVSSCSNMFDSIYGGVKSDGTEDPLYIKEKAASNSDLLKDLMKHQIQNNENSQSHNENPTLSFKLPPLSTASHRDNTSMLGKGKETVRNNTEEVVCGYKVEIDLPTDPPAPTRAPPSPPTLNNDRPLHRRDIRSKKSMSTTVSGWRKPTPPPEVVAALNSISNETKVEDVQRSWKKTGPPPEVLAAMREISDAKPNRPPPAVPSRSASVQISPSRRFKSEDAEDNPTAFLRQKATVNQKILPNNNSQIKAVPVRPNVTGRRANASKYYSLQRTPLNINSEPSIPTAPIPNKFKQKQKMVRSEEILPSGFFIHKATDPPAPTRLPPEPPSSLESENTSNEIEKMGPSKTVTSRQVPPPVPRRTSFRRSASDMSAEARNSVNTKQAPPPPARPATRTLTASNPPVPLRDNRPTPPPRSHQSYNFNP